MRQPDTIADLVSTHPLLAGLPGDGVDLVAGCAQNVAFAEGEVMFVEGGEASTLYLIRRGRVSIEVHAPGRGQVVVETVFAGSVVGWSWLIPPYRWHFDARALEPVGAIAVDGTCLRGKAETDPVFGYELMKRFAAVMVNRLQAAQVRLLDLYAPPVDSIRQPGPDPAAG